MVFQTLAVVIIINLFGISIACRGGRLIRNGLVGSIDKYEILKAHNDYRDEVAQGKIPRQPGAENMLEMQWDDELAQVAQTWADQCVYAHNQDRTVNRFDFGENLAIELNSAITELRDNGNEFPSRVRLWFEEYKYYTFGQGFSRNTGHYTQVIWAETNLVGCGFAYYKGSDGFYARFYVCNYGPAGNIRGEKPYITGNPSCSKHTLKPSQQYRGLCQAASGINSSSTIDSGISNDIELPVGHDPFITNFIPTTTELYTTKLIDKPLFSGQSNSLFTRPTVKSEEITLPPATFTYQTTPKTNPLTLGINKPIRRKSTNPSTTNSKVREVIIKPTTKYSPVTTVSPIPLKSLADILSATTTAINEPFTASTNQNNKSTFLPSFTPESYNNQQSIQIPNRFQSSNTNNNRPTTLRPSYPITPQPARTQIRPNISQREYEAIIYNQHRQRLNDVFRRQQQQAAQRHSFLANSGPTSPYYTYRWSELFNDSHRRATPSY